MDGPFGRHRLSSIVTAIFGAPLEWCSIPGGQVTLMDATPNGGDHGGEYRIAGFWMAKYPVTNSQYQAFIEDTGGSANPAWWEFSLQARQWHSDHPRPGPAAFAGAERPRTRVSWFDSMAFCAWLSDKAAQQGPQAGRVVRLPAEQEWQRAALGDSGWAYPWGNDIDPSRANYANHHRYTTPVEQYPAGSSPYGVMDMIGNVWEWCLTGWGMGGADVSGYGYRIMRGGAWNVSNLRHLRADSRSGHPPRGRLNDAGFRLVYADAWL